METLPLGKLPPEHLQHLLEMYTRVDERVLLGSAIGEDATVIDFGATCLVAKTDPITFATDEIGWYAVHVNANDVAVTGGKPRWFLATVLLPEGRADLQTAEHIFQQLAEACDKLDVSLCGGHTEVTHGLDRPIVVGQMLGEVPRDRIVSSSGGRPGDALLLSKGIAVEGTAVIAREKALELSDRYPEAFLESCRAMLRHPGISVVQEAGLALQEAPVHAMHDPTEGGLAMGLWELALASGTGLAVTLEEIPILPETQLLCEEYHLDPLGVIASGSLLVAVDPAYVTRILHAWEACGIAGAVIGHLVSPQEGVSLIQDGVKKALPRFDRDEIAKLFES